MFILSIPDSLPHKEFIWVLDIKKKHYSHIARRNIDATYMTCTHQAKLHRQKEGLCLCRTAKEGVETRGDWQLLSVWFWVVYLREGDGHILRGSSDAWDSSSLSPPPPPPRQPHRFACGSGYVHRSWHSSLTRLHSELLRGNTQMFRHLISHRAGGWPEIFQPHTQCGRRLQMAAATQRSLEQPESRLFKTRNSSIKEIIFK